MGRNKKQESIGAWHEHNATWTKLSRKKNSIKTRAFHAFLIPLMARGISKAYCDQRDITTRSEIRTSGLDLTQIFRQYTYLHIAVCLAQMSHGIEAITIISVRYPKPVHAIMRCRDTVLFAPYSFTPTSQSRPEQKEQDLGKGDWLLFVS